MRLRVFMLSKIYTYDKNWTFRKHATIYWFMILLGYNSVAYLDIGGSCSEMNFFLPTNRQLKKSSVYRILPIVIDIVEYLCTFWPVCPRALYHFIYDNPLLVNFESRFGSKQLSLLLSPQSNKYWNIIFLFHFVHMWTEKCCLFWSFYATYA